MPADRDDLARRVAFATAEDTSRGLNYTTLFGLVRELAGADAAIQVDSKGTGHRVDFFTYPIAEYLPCVWHAIDRLEGKLGGVDGVLHELGRRTVASFLASMIGRTIITMSGRDPRRIVSGGPAGYRSAVSYGERTVEWLGPTRARMTFTRDFMPPAFHRAVILTALQASTGADPRVEGRATGLLDSTYDIAWDA